MPPKVKVTKKEIVDTALALCRGNGPSAVNARAIAASLNCSTQPIFSNFQTMDDLQTETVAAAYELYLDYLKREAESGKYPAYKSYGLAYVRFAKDEKELFKLLFMRDRSQEDTSLLSVDFETSVQMIMQANGVTLEKARLMHMEMWTCVHGIGVMLATSFLPLEWELISNMMSDVYQGIRARHLTEGS